MLFHQDEEVSEDEASEDSAADELLLMAMPAQGLGLGLYIRPSGLGSKPFFTCPP